MGATLGKSGGHFLDALPTQSTVHVVMLGLDSAGKTTALYRLKFDQYLNTVPTIGFNCEKVQGTLGKAKGVQFLVWDVGGQEKLRPLWRSYTRCTDGILFVIDSVDIERMEEAKMELMRTAKCPDNQGVPVLILANKQDLPGAQDPVELEKLLGLHELLYYANIMATTTSKALSSAAASSSTATTTTTTTSSTSAYNMNSISSSTTTTTTAATAKNEQQQNNSYNKKHIPISLSYTSPLTTKTLNDEDSETTKINNTSMFKQHQQQQQPINKSYSQDFKAIPKSPLTPTTTTTKSQQQQQNKCWFIQPACAITGEGLQEGLEALYEMILRRRKLNKVQKRRR